MYPWARVRVRVSIKGLGLGLGLGLGSVFRVNEVSWRHLVSYVYDVMTVRVRTGNNIFRTLLTVPMHAGNITMPLKVQHLPGLNRLGGGPLDIFLQFN